MEWNQIVSIIGAATGITALIGFFRKLTQDAMAKGRQMQEAESMKENLNRLGRKVNEVRDNLQEQIDDTRDKHGELAREVSEVKTISKSNNEMLQQLVKHQMEGQHS